MRFRSVALAALLIGSVAAGSAEASTILFNQALTVNSGSTPLSSRNSDFVTTTTNQAADDFSLAAAGNVNQVMWWGSYFGNAVLTDTFTIRFYANAAGTPATTAFQEFTGLAPTRVATAFTAIDPPLTNPVTVDAVYQYTVDLGSAVSLLGSTTYYISILNERTGAPNNYRWDFISQFPNGSRWDRGGDATSTGAWDTKSGGSGKYAFVLLNNDLGAQGTSVAAVPEPASLVLLGTGLALAAAGARRRLKAPRKA